MRRWGWLAAFLLVVGLVASARAYAQGTVEELLRAAPADAAVTVVVRSFTDFQQELAMVANTVVPGQGMTLPMVLQQVLGTPGGQGLNLANSLGVVVLPLEGGGLGSGVLLPMASYPDFAAALQQMGFTKGVADGLDSYSAEGFAGPATYYAAGEGAYRYWTQDKPAALAYQKRFAAQAPTLAAELPAATKALIAGADVSVYATMGELAPRVQSFATHMTEQVDAAASRSGLPPQQAERLAAAQKVLHVELDALGAVLAQLDWGLLTADMNQGTVTVRVRVQAKPDTTAAHFFQNQAAADTPLLAQLPAESWLAVSGKVNIASVIPAFKDLTSKFFAAMGTTDPETLARLGKLVAAMEVNTGEMAFAMLPGGEKGGFLNMLQLTVVTDPARALEAAREGQLLWRETPTSSIMGGGVIDFSKAEASPLETYRGVEVSQVAVPFSTPEGVPPQATEILQRMYGDRFLYQYAASGNTLIATVGSRANELIKKAIDGLKDGATGVGASPAYQSAIAGLPKNRSVTGFFSLVRVAQAVMDMVSSFEGETGEPHAQMESLEGVTPAGVGLAASFEAGQVVGDIYIPQAELANLGAVVKGMMRQSFAPGAPGGPVPVPPAPRPLPPPQP
jgi:hypothetical protein